MALRGLIVCVLVFCMSILLVQGTAEINSTTDDTKNATVTDNAIEPTTITIVAKSTEKPTEKPATKAPVATTKATSGAEGMFSAASFAVYVLCTILVARG